MTEPQRIALLLAYGTDMVAAALLVAIAEDETVDVFPDDLRYVQQLEAAGCLRDGKGTPLGLRVALALQAQHGVRPLGRWN